MKEMNWMYVVENYGKVFEETFNKESEALDVVKLQLGDAIKMTKDELLDGIRKLESEMAFLNDNKDMNIEYSTILWNWCLNMVQNIMFVIDNFKGDSKND